MSKPRALLLLGPTGSGKTPLGDWLQAHGLGGRRCHHFDFGANLRALAARGPSAEFSQSDIVFVRHVLEHGALLENETFWLAEKILLNFLDARRVGAEDLVILNGLPRHVGQAEALGHRLDVQAVIHLVCDACTVVERLRRNSGGDRTGRADDSAALLAQKLAIYRARTEPLAAYYSSQQIPIRRVAVEVETTAAELGARVVSLLT